MAVDSAPGAAMRRRQRRLRQFLRHERLTVAMALAEAQHHAAPRRQKPASAITVNDAPRGQKNADAEYFELSSDEEVASARGDAVGSALGAPAAGAGPATHRGADRRLGSGGPFALHGRAAEGGTVGGCLEGLRPAAARAGYRSSQDPVSTTECSHSPPCAADGRSVGGSADEYLLDDSRVRICGGCSANPWMDGSTDSVWAARRQARAGYKYWPPRRWLRPLWTSLWSSATSSSSPFVESVEVPQLPLIDIVVGFVASQRQGSQCKLCRRPDVGQVQFLDWDTPVVVQRQGRMVQTVQSGGAAGAVPATLWTSLRSCRTSRSPGEAGRCLRFSSSPELGYEGSEGGFSGFSAFFALLRVVPELSASCSLGALDDEEFFVIEGSGVALTPGVTPMRWATRGMGQGTGAGSLD